MDFCYTLKCALSNMQTPPPTEKGIFKLLWSRAHIGWHFLVIFGDFRSDRELFPLQSLCLKSGDKDK